jgi:hypothetical protein
MDIIREYLFHIRPLHCRIFIGRLP